MRLVKKLIFLLLITGCGDFSPISGISSESNGSLGFPEDGAADSFKPSICSDLSFDNVQWPTGISDELLNSFALSMNITGSFEGHDGWENIANNFDGQGLSLGLFNQNLGQGTLQPLLITFRDSDASHLPRVFSPTQIQQLNQMLNAWGDSSDGIVLSKAQESHPLIADTSPLDKDEFFFTKAIDAKSQASVDWAAAALYSGTSFRPEWRSALQNMASQPEYVSLQVAAARNIHSKAVGYMTKLQFRELRSYLFFFDIVVQNGGLTTSVENQYLSWYQTNRGASEAARLRQILEYRLALVRAEYVNDVRARKLSVINGTGFVHGSSRNFPQEYCGPSWSTRVL